MTGDKVLARTLAASFVILAAFAAVPTAQAQECLPSEDGKVRACTYPPNNGHMGACQYSYAGGEFLETGCVWLGENGIVPGAFVWFNTAGQAVGFWLLSSQVCVFVNVAGAVVDECLRTD